MHAKNDRGMFVLFCTAVLSIFFLSMLGRVDSAPLPALEGTPAAQAYLPVVAKQFARTATPFPPDDLAVEQSIVSQINQQRRASGLPALTLDGALTQAARRHCHDMAEHDFTSHTGSDGSSAQDRVEQAGYEGTYVGEIIGWGFGSPESVIAWWMNSAPHRSLILSSRATELGVGYVRDPASRWGQYYTVNFGMGGSRVAASREPLHLCAYVEQEPTGGSGLEVYRSGPCP